MFGLVIPFSAAALLFSLRLEHVPTVSGVMIDGVGACLAAAAVTLLSLGINNFHD